MAKKKDLCKECNGELGEDGVCQDCGWIKEDEAIETKEDKEEDTDDEESDWDEDEGKEEEY